MLEPRNLTVVVNTGDDETFHGLDVSPDLDTMMYALAGMSSWSPGWGIRGDSFHAKRALERLGAPGWFALGDRDLATHIYRTHRLREGAGLSRVTRELCARLGVRQRILPMSDDRVRTFLRCEEGLLPFQDYLVRRRARPRVRAVSLRGIRGARPAPGVIEALRAADRVVIAPSNPLVSIAPILALPGVRRTLAQRRARVWAVSPLVGGRAVKGPLVAMLRGVGRRPDNSAIADLYAPVAATLLVGKGEVPRRPRRAEPIGFLEADTLMSGVAGARRLARTLLEDRTDVPGRSQRSRRLRRG